ncbi:hypothetical protein SLA2020_347660 [Shorea laevis]
MEKESNSPENNIINEDNQEQNHVPPADVLMKRKRGRPRKHLRLRLNHREKAHDLEIQDQNQEDIARCPPGFDVVNSHQNNNEIPGNRANDVMVGQVVNGIIEAAFDAGYLLTVRVGNSETALRGVVFKPGHVIPVSADNDVAPNVPMIRRNGIPFPKERSRRHVNSHRNGSARTAYSAANFGVPEGTPGHLVTTHNASPTISRGTLVPVVLQPVKLGNGGSVTNQPVQIVSQPPHLVASRSNQLSEAARASNKATTTGQVATVGFQNFPPPQNAHQLMPKVMQSEAGTCEQLRVEVSGEVEAKSMRSPGAHFEKLLTEVTKRVQASSQPVDVQASHNLKDNKPLSIKPLQSIQPDHSAPQSKPLENYRIGKMTQLLQAVQENIRENQAAEAAGAAFVSRETELEEKENDDSENPSLA